MSSGNAKLKFKKEKPTPAEALLKRKHDDTKNLVNSMNQKQPNAEDIERHFSKQRKLARQPTYDDSQVTGGQTQGQGNTELIGVGTANIHNNINVAINYTVH